MIIALAQTNIIWEDKDLNLSKVRVFVEKFCGRYKRSAQEKLILFPEMSLTGFSMHTSVTAEQEKETVGKIAELAREFGVHIGIGWVKACGEKCENHYSILSPQGEEILDYAKIHPFSYSEEDKYFQGGTKLSSCSIGDMKVGASICYDLRFPEQFRALGQMAELIVVPANWPEKRSEHWKVLLQARAIENQCYVAGVNCCGDMDGQYYSGDSALYGADGYKQDPVEIMNTIFEGEQLLVYQVRNNVHEVRGAFPVLKDIVEI